MTLASASESISTLELGGELLDSEQEEDNTGPRERKRESGDRRAFFEEQGERVVL